MVVDSDAAVQFLRTAFEPGDWIAVFLKSYQTGRTAQRVGPLALFVEPLAPVDEMPSASIATSASTPSSWEVARGRRQRSEPSGTCFLKPMRTVLACLRQSTRARTFQSRRTFSNRRRTACMSSGAFATSPVMPSNVCSDNWRETFAQTSRRPPVLN
jgi:hypothetical protein